MLQNAYFLAKIGADTAENEQHFAEILPKQKLSWLSTSLWRITWHPKTWAPVKQQHLMDRAPQILGIRDASQNEEL